MTARVGAVLVEEAHARATQRRATTGRMEKAMAVDACASSMYVFASLDELRYVLLGVVGWGARAFATSRQRGR